MGKLIDFKSVAKPINLENRKEKLEKRRQEIIAEHESIRKRADQLLRKK
ncbi:MULTISPECIES: hypothetical protein [Bacillus]|nr:MULTISPECIES: hypothetical protein [Bacillus]